MLFSFEIFNFFVLGKGKVENMYNFKNKHEWINIKKIKLFLKDFFVKSQFSRTYSHIQLPHTHAYIHTRSY